MNDVTASALNAIAASIKAAASSKPLMYAALIGTWVLLDQLKIDDAALKSTLRDAIFGLGVAHVALTSPSKSTNDQEQQK